MDSEDSSCCPTPVDNLRLPDQTNRGVGFQTPNQKAIATAIEKRYGKFDDSPDSTKPTPFKRAVPGCENC